MTTTPHQPPPLGPGAPSIPVALAGDPDQVGAHLSNRRVEVPAAVVDRLSAACASVSTEPEVLADSSRDWWPLAMTWALDNEVANLAGAVARPAGPDEVAAVLRICNEARVPVTAAAGRSGVCGASVPLYGGVVVDLCDLAGIRSVDDRSLTVDVRCGTFGDHFEAELRDDHGVSTGHWPQSVELSTVGGWLACRGAGQFSTRYGKIEDMVIGMDVVLADGQMLHTGGNARQAAGPDLNQLFVGSEGTLGIITAARLRVHPVPGYERRAAYGFASFEEGLDTCRRVLRRGAHPAVLRLYDEVEATRSYATEGMAVLLVLDEGEARIVDPTMEVVEGECAVGHPLDESLVGRWLEHRNDVSQLEPLITTGLVVDTMEITGPWASLPTIYVEATKAIGGVDGTLVASAHLSHSYPDGACLYFTFAGKIDGHPTGTDAKDAYYRRAWDAGTLAVLDHGGSISHHHGIGVSRGRFMRQALGGGLDVLSSVKHALDPNGILNPGKLGLASPFGPNPFAETMAGAR
jgi:alkyldihydroxyacetonephosphate synthase